MVIGLIDGWKIIEECELHKVRVEGDLAWLGSAAVIRNEGTLDPKS